MMRHNNAFLSCTFRCSLNFYSRLTFYLIILHILFGKKWYNSLQLRNRCDKIHKKKLYIKGVFIIKKLISFVAAAVVAVCLFTACSGGANSRRDDMPDVEPMDYNYLTGLPFDDGQDKSARPVAVMINNAKIALPQYGLSNADIIYEAVTEGGITRMMALYSDINDIDRVGPVRSARTQFVQLMLPLNAIYVHIGSSTTAGAMLNAYSYQDIDGIYLGSLAFEYDIELAKTKSSEHCWFTNKDLIKAGINKTGIMTKNNFYPAFEFVPYGSEKRVLSTDGANTVSYRYSSYADVSFTYDSESGRYKKDAFGTPHIDAATKEQIAFDNVFVLVANVGIEEQNGILPDFDYSGGTGYYFHGGKYDNITWEKGEPEYPLVMYSSDGSVLKVNTGTSYVGIIAKEQEETLKITEEIQTSASVERVQ